MNGDRGNKNKKKSVAEVWQKLSELFSDEPHEAFLPDLNLVPSSAPQPIRQRTLIRLLNQLCTENGVEIRADQEAAMKYYHFFYRLYFRKDEQVFRHNYSDICRLIYNKSTAKYEDGQPTSGIPDEILNLQHNIETIITLLSTRHNEVNKAIWDLTNSWPETINKTSSNNPEPISSQNAKNADTIESMRKTKERLERVVSIVNKLYDHISLEVERLRLIYRQNSRHQAAIAAAREQFEQRAKSNEASMDRYEKVLAGARREIQQGLKNNKDELENARKDLQRENITVLGIFAAVVLVINGAISFSSASLSAIGAARGVVPVLLMTDLVAFASINTVGVLFIFIWKLTKGGNPDFGKWPESAWRWTNRCLVVLFVLLSLTRVPCFRSFIGLP